MPNMTSKIAKPFDPWVELSVWNYPKYGFNQACHRE